MILFKCKMCGGDIQVMENEATGICDSCYNEALSLINSDNISYDDYKKAIGILEELNNYRDTKNIAIEYKKEIIKLAQSEISSYNTKLEHIKLNNFLKECFTGIWYGSIIGGFILFFSGMWELFWLNLILGTLVLFCVSDPIHTKSNKLKYNLQKKETINEYNEDIQKYEVELKQ